MSIKKTSIFLCLTALLSIGHMQAAEHNRPAMQMRMKEKSIKSLTRQINDLENRKHESHTKGLFACCIPIPSMVLGYKYGEYADTFFNTGFAGRILGTAVGGVASTAFAYSVCAQKLDEIKGHNASINRISAELEKLKTE